jgi:hypothetical protein
LNLNAYQKTSSINNLSPRPSPLQDHIESNPFYIGLYPFIGVISLLAELPFLMYISLSNEFGPNMHPLLRPTDYLFLLKKLVSAAQQNNMKVSSKEL